LVAGPKRSSGTPHSDATIYQDVAERPEAGDNNSLSAPRLSIRRVQHPAIEMSKAIPLVNDPIRYEFDIQAKDVLISSHSRIRVTAPDDHVLTVLDLHL
jgi:hypothetical protein